MTSQQSEPSVNIVFPWSNRVPIAPTTVTPYYWIGELSITFPNGTQGTGTGTLIDEYYVLTCAHNLYAQEFGGYATQVTIALARNSQNFPYPSVDATQLWIPEEYEQAPAPFPIDPVVDYTKYLYDYGLIKLKSGLSPAGITYPPMYAADDVTLTSTRVDIAGYPGDKPLGTMWNAGGNLPGVQEELLFYQISTYAGQSGSAVRANFPNLPNPIVPRLVGIHVAGSQGLNTNFAVRITEDVINTVNGWM